MCADLHSTFDFYTLLEFYRNALINQTSPEQRISLLEVVSNNGELPRGYLQVCAFPGTYPGFQV